MLVKERREPVEGTYLAQVGDGGLVVGLQLALPDRQLHKSCHQASQPFLLAIHGLHSRAYALQLLSQRGRCRRAEVWSVAKPGAKGATQA